MNNSELPVTQTDAPAAITSAPCDAEGETVEPPPQLPNGMKGYFACRGCRRILNEAQWFTDGCLECGTGPLTRGDLNAYATSRFHNFIGLIAPEQSWVARLIGKTECPNGVFAEALSDDEYVDEQDDEGFDDDDLYDDEPGDENGAKAGEHLASQRLTDEELLALE